MINGAGEGLNMNNNEDKNNINNTTYLLKKMYSIDEKGFDQINE